MEQKKITGNDLARMMPDMIKGIDNILDRSEKYLKSGKKHTNEVAEKRDELEEASNGSMSAMPGKIYAPRKTNKALAKINAITKR